MRDARASLDALARWLAVRAGFEPLGLLLPLGPQAEGLFDACLGRWEGADLRVHALMADEGGDSGQVARRAELLRGVLRRAEPMVKGRLRAGVWLVVADAARAAALRASLFGFEDAHFLSKTVVGRGLLCVETGLGEFSGRSASQPDAGELAGVLADPSADPGQADAERVRLDRERAALERARDERGAQVLLRPGPSPATWVLMALNFAYFAVELQMTAVLERRGVSASVAAATAMIKLGANEPALTLGQGQWWRLLACAFLHGGWWHIGLNMYALFLIGAVLERLIGPWRLLGLYLLSALVAGLVSALAAGPGAYSVGASGAIMGLVGVLMAPRFRRDPRFPGLLADRLFQWLSRPVAFIFVLGVGLRWFDVPLLLDNWAHLGGLLAGFTLGYVWPSFLVRPTSRRA